MLACGELEPAGWRAHEESPTIAFLRSDRDGRLAADESFGDNPGDR